MPTLMTSPDGIDWTLQDNSPWDSTPGVFGWSVSASDDSVVAIAQEYLPGNPQVPTDVLALSRSTDGTTWGGVSSLADTENGGFTVRYIASLGLYVASIGGQFPGGANIIQSDDDGVTWVNTIDTPLAQTSTVPWMGWQNLGYATDTVFSINRQGENEGGTGIYAGTGSPLTWVEVNPSDLPVLGPYQTCCASDDAGNFCTADTQSFGFNDGTYAFDGTSWYWRGLPIEGGSILPEIAAMGFGDGTWMLCTSYIATVSLDATAWTTTDPSTVGWTAAGTFPDADFTPVDLAYGNSGTWVAVGGGIAPNPESPATMSGQVYYSTDAGVTWTEATVPLDVINGVCWSDTLGLFVAVGYLAPTRGGWTIGDVNWSGSGWAVGTTP